MEEVEVLNIIRMFKIMTKPLSEMSLLTYGKYLIKTVTHIPKIRRILSGSTLRKRKNYILADTVEDRYHE